MQIIINPIRKWAEDLKNHFLKANNQMTNKFMERCTSSPLIIKTNQVKKITGCLMPHTCETVQSKEITIGEDMEMSHHLPLPRM